jgi:hypothetical protein
VYLVDSNWLKMFKAAFYPEEENKAGKPKRVSSKPNQPLQAKKMKLPLLTNERIVHDQKNLKKSGDYLICKDKNCQFNHVLKPNVRLGVDFEVVSAD